MIVNSAFSNNGGTNPALNGQWSSYRYAFLFKPGTHSVTVPVGYYTSVYGLGISPTDTTIQEVSVADGSDDYTTGALCNFWRSAEKLRNLFNLLFRCWIFYSITFFLFFSVFFFFANKKTQKQKN